MEFSIEHRIYYTAERFYSALDARVISHLTVTETMELGGLHASLTHVPHSETIPLNKWMKCDFCFYFLFIYFFFCFVFSGGSPFFYYYYFVSLGAELEGLDGTLRMSVVRLKFVYLSVVSLMLGHLQLSVSCFKKTIYSWPYTA